jgi:uncharacterized membrane protein YjfL (UPF0719 family)
MLTDLGYGLATGLAYAAVGTVLIVVGFVVVDLLTPGSLRRLVWAERNRNAVIVLSSGLLGTAAVVVTAILTSDDDFGRGIVSTVGYGLLGLLLMAVSFVVVDLLTPGRLGELLMQAEPHPAARVTASAHLSVALRSWLRRSPSR